MTLRVLSLSALAALAVAAAPVAAVAQTAPAGHVLYTVKRGDTLFGLWQSYFTGPSAVQRVQKLNNIANSRQIPVGKVLRIPRALLRFDASQATVEAFSGQVMVRRGGHSHAARLGEKLDEGAQIDCGRNSFVTLRLADNSALAIPSQSTLQLTKLRKIKLTGGLDREISVSAGRVRAKVTPSSNPENNFRVVTPVAVSAVRGTAFRVDYDGNEAFSASQVDQGQVVFAGSPGSDELLLTTGFGAADVKGKATGVVKLLDPPKLVNPGKVQSAENLQFALTPLSDATRYHLQIAMDAGFLETITEATQAQPAFDLPALAAGSYFARVSAYDGFGLEGTAQTYSFERRLNLVSGGVDGGSDSGSKLRFKWDGTADGTPQYRFQMLRKGEPNVPVVDEAGLTAKVLTVSNLAPGDYLWRVGSSLIVKGELITTWTEPQSLLVSK